MKRLVSLLAATGALAVASGAMATAIPFELNSRPATIVDTAGQASLQEVIDSVVGSNKIDASTGQSKVGAWTMAEANVDAYRIALVSPKKEGTLGIFSLTSRAEYALIEAKNNGTDTNNNHYTSSFSIDRNKTTGAYRLVIDSKAVDTNFGKAFGFYWKDGGNMSYTLDTLNPQGKAEALSYLVPDLTSVTLNSDPDYETVTTASGNNDWIVAFDNQISGKNAYDSLTDFNDAVFYMEDMNPVPEPGTMMLLGAGFLGLAIYGKRRKNA